VIKTLHLKLLLLLILGVFISGLSCLFLASETRIALLTILISFTLMVTLGLFIWWNAKKNGIFDIIVLFSVFFLVYNAFLPIEVSLQYLLSHKIDLNYPLQFGIEQFTLTALLSLLAGTMFMIGTKLKFGLGPSVGTRLLDIKLDHNLSYYMGFLLYVFGVLLFFLDYNRVGGFFYALKLDRVIRLNLLSATRGSLPYFPFVLVGIALMAYGSLIKSKFKIKLFLTIVLSLFFISLLALGGDRRFSLYILLVLLSTYSLIKGPIRLNWRILLAGIIIYILFVVFQKTRWMFPLIFKGDLTLQSAYQIFISNFSYTMFFLGSTEVMGPYLSLLHYSAYTPPLLVGKSYLYALPYLLPRSLYIGMKAPTISQEFAYQIHEAFYYQNLGITGWGFNPVAESIANFGFMGPIIVFLLVGLIFALANRIKKRGKLGGIIYVLLSPVVFNLNRADFANAFQEITYYIVLVFVVFMLICLIQGSLGSIKSEQRYHEQAKPF
jgi:oligosaccharide repeat unit polymerase